jgi:hypothetical protein
VTAATISEPVDALEYDDAAALHFEALRRFAPNHIRALAWLVFEWRSAPDEYERGVIREASRMIRDRMTVTERVSWMLVIRALRRSFPTLSQRANRGH